MIPRLILLFVLLGVPRVLAQALPELGDASAAAISPADERRLGEDIMRQIRQDPAYLDDPEAADYVNSLGSRLTVRSDSARQEFEFFVVRDPQINAFALPGGYLGLHMGLLAVVSSRDELASYCGVLKRAGRGVIEMALTKQFGRLQDDEYDLLDFMLTNSNRPVTWLSLHNIAERPNNVQEVLEKDM